MVGPGTWVGDGTGAGLEDRIWVLRSSPKVAEKAAEEARLDQGGASQEWRSPCNSMGSRLVPALSGRGRHMVAPRITLCHGGPFRAPAVDLIVHYMPRSEPVSPSRPVN